MKKFFQLIVLLGAVLMLTGCPGTMPTKPEERIVYKTKVIYLTPPLNLLERVSVVQPPDKKTFLMMTDQQRVGVLTDKYIEQTQQVAQCNRNLEGVETWIEKQLVLHKEQEEKK